MQKTLDDSLIVSDPKICGGEPVFRGTRVTLRTILASLAEGCSISDILADFPTLTEDHMRAAIQMAANAALDELPPRPNIEGLHAD